MSKLLVRWVLFTVAIVAASAIAQMLNVGFHAEAKEPSDFLYLMLGAAVLALINATVDSVLRLVTAPLRCLTFGLVSLVINALVLMMAANLVPWFSVDNFMGALVGSLLIAVFNALLKNLVPAAKDDD